MAINFTEILAKTVGSAPEPKPLPSGSYTGTINGVPTCRAVTTKEGDKAVATFTIAITEAMDDVDETELTEAGGLRRNDGEPKSLRADFWLDESSLYKLDQFLAGFGFASDSGKSYQDVFEELAGRDVELAVELDEYTTKKGDQRRVNNIKRIHAAA
jgi:hypothetical protein